MSCRRREALGSERPLQNPSALGLRILCVFHEVRGDVGDNAGPEFVYGRGEGYGSVLVQHGGVPLFVDEACANGGLVRGV